MFFAKKQPSFDESPLQDLSTDQLSQISGGAGISLTSLLSQIPSGSSSSLKSEVIAALLQEWKKLHPTSPLNLATIQQITSEAQKILAKP